MLLGFCWDDHSRSQNRWDGSQLSPSQTPTNHPSVFFGFNDTELVSLYDIPGILANHLDFERKVLMDNLLGDWPQAYLYTCCQEGLQNPDFVKCLWEGETLNKTMPSFDSFDEVPCKTHR